MVKERFSGGDSGEARYGEKGSDGDGRTWSKKGFPVVMVVRPDMGKRGLVVMAGNIRFIGAIVFPVGFPIYGTHTHSWIISPSTLLDSRFVFPGYHPRNCDKFYHLIPPLGDLSKTSDYLKIPVFSLQVTFFPNCGFSVGVTYNHCVADGRSKFVFLNAWMSIAQCGTDESFLASGSLPFYGRVISYPERDKSVLVNAKFEALFGKECQPPKLSGTNDKVRSTFVLTRPSIERLKKLVSTQVPTLPYVSAFTVTCAYIWCCLAKARNENEHQGFMFGVDVRSRLDPPVPASYMGKCINTRSLRMQKPVF